MTEKTQYKLFMIKDLNKLLPKQFTPGLTP